MSSPSDVIAVYPGFDPQTLIDTYGPISMSVSSSEGNGVFQVLGGLNYTMPQITTISANGTSFLSFVVASSNEMDTITAGAILDYDHNYLSWNLTNGGGADVYITASYAACVLYGITASQGKFVLPFGNDILYLNRCPWFVWAPSLNEFDQPLDSTYQGIYEDQPVWKSRFSADATRKYSVGRLNTATSKDWSWQGEPRSNVFTMYTGSFGNESPWSTGQVYTLPHYTWQQLKLDTRANVPFLVVTSSLGSIQTQDIENVYHFRDEGVLFQETMQQSGWDQSWNLSVKASVLSKSL